MQISLIKRGSNSFAYNLTFDLSYKVILTPRYSFRDKNLSYTLLFVLVVMLEVFVRP